MGVKIERGGFRQMIQDKGAKCFFHCLTPKGWNLREGGILGFVGESLGFNLCG